MPEKTKSVFQRLADVKKELSKMEIKKSGNNKYAGFRYHELSDFLPFISELNAKHGIDDNITFDKENNIASITVINTEDVADRKTITVPYVEAEMLGKGGAKSSVDAVQRLGSTITYLRRYLYMTMYNITEQDALDATVQKNDDSGNTKTESFNKGKQVSSAQSKAQAKTQTNSQSNSKQKSAKKEEDESSESNEGDGKKPASKAQVNLLESMKKQGKIKDDLKFCKKDEKGNITETLISKGEAKQTIDEVNSGESVTFVNHEDLPF